MISMCRMLKTAQVIFAILTLGGIDLVAAQSPRDIKAADHSLRKIGTGCEASYLNSPQVLDWLNSSVGKNKGFPLEVGSVGNIENANDKDLDLLGLPGTEGVVVGGHPATIACHANVVFKNGLQQAGIIDVIAPNHKIFGYGRSTSLVVAWASDDVIEEIKHRASVDREKSIAEQKKRLQDAQNEIDYSNNLQTCNLMWEIGSEAKSQLSAGEPTAMVIDDLVRRYAYGPNGEAFRGSSDVEQMVRDAVGDPDKFSTQTFLSKCMAEANREAGQKIQ